MRACSIYVYVCMCVCVSYCIISLPPPTFLVRPPHFDGSSSVRTSIHSYLMCVCVCVHVSIRLLSFAYLHDCQIATAYLHADGGNLSACVHACVCMCERQREMHERTHTRTRKCHTHWLAMPLSLSIRSWLYKRTACTIVSENSLTSVARTSCWAW